jgi:hypothetical protein
LAEQAANANAHTTATSNRLERITASLNEIDSLRFSNAIQQRAKRLQSRCRGTTVRNEAGATPPSWVDRDKTVADAAAPGPQGAAKLSRSRAGAYHLTVIGAH